VLKAMLLLAVFFLAMLLPYLPGGFDASAAALSYVTQVAGYASLLLVPVGGLWLIDKRRGRVWRRTAQIIAMLIVFVTILAAAAMNQLGLGVVIGTLAMLAVLRTTRKLPAGDDHTDRTRNPVALYLVVVPLLVVGFRTAVVPRAAAWSADRAIRHSAGLIAEIEAFRERRGHYPLSLQSLHRDFPTGVIGIERFHYEPNGEAYNLYFVRQSTQLDAKEVVLFNPRDEHRFTSHELDILQYDGVELDQRRGDRRRTPLAHPQWISILFD